MFVIDVNKWEAYLRPFPTLWWSFFEKSWWLLDMAAKTQPYNWFQKKFHQILWYIMIINLRMCHLMSDDVSRIWWWLFYQSTASLCTHGIHWCIAWIESIVNVNRQEESLVYDSKLLPQLISYWKLNMAPWTLTVLPIKAFTHCFKRRCYSKQPS